MRAENQEERRSARHRLFYATTSAAVPDLATFDSRLLYTFERHSGMVRTDQTSDVQLHIGESRDSGFARSLSSGAHSRDPLARPGTTGHVAATTSPRYG